MIEERSRQLLEVSANKRVEEHEGGLSMFSLLVIDETLNGILCHIQATSYHRS